MGQTVNLQEAFEAYKREDQIVPVAAGSYDLEVTSVKVRETGVTPVFKIISGPDAGKKVLAGVFTLSDKARSVFFQNMAGFGLDNSFFAGATSMQHIADALVGRKVRVELIIDKWNGQDRNKIPIGRIQLLEAPAQVAPGLGSVAAVAPPATPPVAAAVAPPVAATVAPPAPAAVPPPTPVPAEAPAAPPAQPPIPPVAPPAAPQPQEAVPPSPAPPAPPAGAPPVPGAAF